ncbi:MAG: hypothetical protein RIS34_561 [Pseudomonadota bacterium]|jgi:transcriptional regulator of acetoin/glycerol metabolism
MQPLATNAEQRLRQIDQARQAVLRDNRPLSGLLPESWIERSWRRCLQNGIRPDQPVSFDLIPAQALRRTEEANHTLLTAARPILDKLGRAVADTRYFAILTNAEGVVVDVNGPINRRDRRADVISRIGVDLSEAKVGTTAIGAALTELQPVWLHRGEHFFDANSAYSCAGAPLLGPDGRCVGMLDLTGIEATERPELKHLVMHSARSIENALTLNQKHFLTVRITWPGHNLDEDTDGLVCLDADGWVTGANSAARQMIPHLMVSGTGRIHSSDLFAMSYELLFAGAQHRRTDGPSPLDVPLWSGLRLHAVTSRTDSPHELTRKGLGFSAPLPLKETETALIRQAVAQAKGNVMKAALALGISRATVYRKLGNKK